ncbi:MAG: nickel-binding protein [Acidimicrobiia bacterium]
MDRHDVDDDVTPEMVVINHLKDLSIQAEYDVNYMSYWFDSDRNTVNCLIDAPSQENAVEVHRHSHGLVGSEIIPVDKDTASRFMGRVVDPTYSGDLPNAFRTIVFTDMVDSTQMTQRLGDEEAMRRLRIHDSIIRTTLEGHDGREVKHTGDGILAVFDTTTAGIRGSIAIQNAFQIHNEEHPDEAIRVRIGISAGEPVAESSDLYGLAVNLAARICDYASPESVFVSNAVRELVAGKRFEFSDAVMVEFKGFDDPMPVSQVLWNAAEE